MDQTPAHENHNPDVLKLMPPDARSVIEVGCSSGALAREYKKINAGCRYVGIEVMPQYALLARRHCDTVHAMDIECASEEQLRTVLAGDCWVFGDTLEHLKDPWALLARLRRTMPLDGHIVACIPNAQHWSVQARLACGNFEYEESGLLDKTHLRWFTRKTIIDMFQGAGFLIEAGISRIFEEPSKDKVLPAIRLMAQSVGADAEAAAADALPFQYVLRARPG